MRSQCRTCCCYRFRRFRMGSQHRMEGLEILLIAPDSLGILFLKKMKTRKITKRYDGKLIFGCKFKKMPLTSSEARITLPILCANAGGTVKHWCVLIHAGAVVHTPVVVGAHWG